MRIKELVLETTSDEQNLHSISNSLASVINRLKKTDPKMFTPNKQSEKGLGLGPIKDIIKTNPEYYPEHIQPLLNLHIVVKNLPGRPVKGQYDRANKIITLTLHLINNTQKFDISSTISHELRHALDDTLSQGKALFGKKAEKPYEQRPKEINARLSQAMKMIGDLLKDQLKGLDEFEQISIDDIKFVIDKAFTANRIQQAFGNYKDNKNYRHAFNRALMYAKHTLDTNKKPGQMVYETIIL
jgi:hypothetical protein